MPRKLYPAVVHTDDGKTFGATLIDLHVNGLGASVEEALADAEAIATETVPEYIADGGLPDPTAIADIPEEDRAGALAVSLVPLLIPGKAKRVQVTMDEDLLDRIDAIATNRSAFLAEAARARLAG